MLVISQSAPDFTLLNQNKHTIKLSDFRSKRVVLYFYPKDDTPGCTLEASQFTQLASDFAKIDVLVLGVSKDSCESHSAFIEKYGLKVELLSDTSGQICEAYGVWQEKEKNGIKKMGIVRSTFIIDQNGCLLDVNYGVTADGHAQKVLDKLSN